MSKDVSIKTINSVKISNETFKKLKIIGIDRELPPPEIAGEILDRVIDTFLEKVYKKSTNKRDTMKNVVGGDVINLDINE